MGFYGMEEEKLCRWCGTFYRANKPIGHDGFCSPRCKQAHYRAYKKYVTEKSGKRTSSADHTVTQKKHKK